MASGINAPPVTFVKNLNSDSSKNLWWGDVNKPTTTKVFNNLYGTLKEPAIKELSKGNNVLFDIDWQGTKQIKKHNLNYKLFTIFILPPSIDAIKERLAKREIKDKPIINERMSQFKNDVLHWEEYDYVVINNDLENCYEEIFRAISLKENNKKVDFDKNIIRKKVKELSS